MMRIIFFVLVYALLTQPAPLKGCHRQSQGLVSVPKCRHLCALVRVNSKRESRQREVDIKHLEAIGVMDTGKPKAWPIPARRLVSLSCPPAARRFHHQCGGGQKER